MGFANFIGFERKKLILPVALLVLFVFVLALDALYADDTAASMENVVEASLEALKFIAYNGSLNGTEPFIASQADQWQTKAQVATENFPGVFLIFGASLSGEYVLEMFGANFCATELFFRPEGRDCYATRMDAVFVSELARFVVCGSELASSYYSIFRPEGVPQEPHPLSDEEIAYARAVIFSDTGQNIYNALDDCRALREEIARSGRISDFGALRPYSMTGLFSTSELPNLDVVGPVDIILIALVIFITSYLLSCAILWLHRRNRFLQGEGKKVYLVIVLVLSASIYFFFASGLIADYRIMFFVSLILAYAITTALWWIYGKSKATQIAARVRKA